MAVNDAMVSSQPTYEELKPLHPGNRGYQQDRSQPTYEELKPLCCYCGYSRYGVLSLPMRN